MPDKKSFSALVLYFEQLAANHKWINHSREEKHFFRFELDEVLSGIPVAMNYPVLILEGYNFKLGDHKSDNPLKVRFGAFMILDHVKDIGDYDHIHSVWDTMEVIGDDIIGRIRADKRNTTAPVQSIDINSFEGNLIASELGSHYGIRYTFAIECPFKPELGPERWSNVEDDGYIKY